jgi:hypothetical protein
VTAVLVRVEDDETARISSESHDQKNGQRGTRCPIRPPLTSTHRNDGNGDAEQRNGETQRVSYSSAVREFRFQGEVQHAAEKNVLFLLRSE